MRVMTFNLRADNILDIRNRWRGRCEIVYDTIQEYDCDIIGLQEVTNTMAEDLKRQLKEYHHLGVSRTKNWFMERNTVLLRKEYHVLENKTFWLSKEPHKKGSSLWHSLFPRICTRVIYQLEDGRKVSIYNTHLDCLSPIAREHGMKVILREMYKCQQKEKMPCILMGDFNERANSRMMQQFKRKAYQLNGLRAVQDIKPELYQKTTMGFFKDREKGGHIDYIFVTKEFEVVDVEIIKYNHEGRYPSDHYPIMAELRLK
ncbi:MAG: endonuclease/exonuclease/phosphatase family protein [Cellulosilyticum sp.]|nr:endonuclease/exonuclease/phosphatase family protein [Cellulosilyticum sp.]